MTLKLVIAAFVVGLVLCLSGYGRLRAMERDALALESEVERLARENALLRERIRALASDPDALAAEARGMGLAGEGELVYTFVPGEDDD